MNPIKVIRVFCDNSGNFGNPVGIIVDLEK